MFSLLIVDITYRVQKNIKLNTGPIPSELLVPFQKNCMLDLHSSEGHLNLSLKIHSV